VPQAIARAAAIRNLHIAMENERRCSLDKKRAGYSDVNESEEPHDSSTRLGSRPCAVRDFYEILISMMN